MHPCVIDALINTGYVVRTVAFFEKALLSLIYCRMLFFMSQPPPLRFPVAHNHN